MKTGDIIEGDFIKEEKPEFKGGINIFKNKLKILANDIDLKLKGRSM